MRSRLMHNCQQGMCARTPWNEMALCWNPILSALSQACTGFFLAAMQSSLSLAPPTHTAPVLSGLHAQNPTKASSKRFNPKHQNPQHNMPTKSRTAPSILNHVGVSCINISPVYPVKCSLHNWPLIVAITHALVSKALFAALHLRPTVQQQLLRVTHRCHTESRSSINGLLINGEL